MDSSCSAAHGSHMLIAWAQRATRHWLLWPPHPDLGIDARREATMTGSRYLAWLPGSFFCGSDAHSGGGGQGKGHSANMNSSATSTAFCRPLLPVVEPPLLLSGPFFNVMLCFFVVGVVFRGGLVTMLLEGGQRFDVSGRTSFLYLWDSIIESYTCIPA